MAEEDKPIPHKQHIPVRFWKDTPSVLLDKALRNYHRCLHLLQFLPTNQGMSFPNSTHSFWKGVKAELETAILFESAVCLEAKSNWIDAVLTLSIILRKHTSQLEIPTHLKVINSVYDNSNSTTSVLYSECWSFELSLNIRTTFATSILGGNRGLDSVHFRPHT